MCAPTLSTCILHGGLVGGGKLACLLVNRVGSDLRSGSVYQFYYITTREKFGS